jgi:hypothetical protein
MRGGRKLVAATLTVVAFLSSAGCSLRMGDLTAVASQNVSVSAEPIRRAVEGRDCVHLLLFIPLGSLVPSYEEAVDRALAQVPDANALVNVSMYVEPIFTYVYNRNCLRVKGDAVKIATGGGR